VTYNFKEISVLIVDSQPALVDLIRGALRLLGVPADSLYSFSEGRMALNAFKEKKPDLLILDWEMVDIKGLEFIKIIRNSADHPYVPIIFMTALTTQRKVLEARDCGITEFLAKPFTARTLCDRIEAIVERPRRFVLALDYRGPDRRRRKLEYSDNERRESDSVQDLKMSEMDIFKAEKKIRTASLLAPPNILKKKMGSGGVDTKALALAQNFLESNTVDFKPIGAALVNALEEGLQNSKKDGVESETGIELMLYPAAQLKAQGAMFHFPFLTRIADILVTFLETVEVTDRDVFEIVAAHKVAFLYILSNHITGDGGVYGKTLQGELLDACGRYYKTRNLKP
jgi:two-component system, chemotaxis family, chemotaxis protein CheY